MAQIRNYDIITSAARINLSQRELFPRAALAVYYEQENKAVMGERKAWKWGGAGWLLIARALDKSRIGQSGYPLQY